MSYSRTKIAPQPAHSAAAARYCALLPHLPQCACHWRERRLAGRGFSAMPLSLCGARAEEIAPAFANRKSKASSGAMTCCKRALAAASRRLRGVLLAARFWRGAVVVSPYCAAKSLGARFFVARNVSFVEELFALVAFLRAGFAVAVLPAIFGEAEIFAGEVFAASVFATRGAVLDPDFCGAFFAAAFTLGVLPALSRCTGPFAFSTNFAFAAGFDFTTG